MNEHLKLNHLILLCLSTAVLSLRLTSAVDFLFNGFSPSDVSLYGDATNESRIISLTKHLPSSLGRAVYASRIPTKYPNASFVLPFSTSFIFAMTPFNGEPPGLGMMFVFGPHDGVRYTTSSKHLGLFNYPDGSPNNHIFGVAFDVTETLVGINVNSIFSVNASDPGYWPDNGGGRAFRKLRLNNGRNYQAWVDYVGGVVNVTMAPLGVKRPNRPLLSVPVDLSDVFEDEMYVGFVAATGNLSQSHRVLGWSFSNTNFCLSDGLITRDLPSFEPRTTPITGTAGFVAILGSGFLFVVIGAFLLVGRNKMMRNKRRGMEDWELEYWPHRISYRVIEAATDGFSEENVIGIGANGKVYRGLLFLGGLEVAVKRISRESSQGVRAFSSEISTLGRLKHRGLLGLRGWCKEEKASLVLVYDYMENGSLDKRLFECDENKILRFEERVKVLKQVASAVMYLHHGWESKVLHNDIKSSNVLLDKEMNARLGDFGLAQIHDHRDKADVTSRVVGTVGYIAPEFVRSGRASTKTDVFGYGVLVLEVICGRRPIEQGKPVLVDWLWELLKRGELLNGVGPSLRVEGDLDEKALEKVLRLGLLCAHPDARARPTMRQVVEFFEEQEEVDEQEVQEGMEMNILEKMKNKDFLSSFATISWSNSIGVGR